MILIYINKKNLLLLFISLNTLAVAQSFTRDYKNYSIIWDSTIQKDYVIDTITCKKFIIDYLYARPSYFMNGFVYVKTGDMKGLMSLNGKKLLEPSHFIRFNSKDSIISAYVCGYGWIFLNYKGDTISYGRTTENNYCPELYCAFNPAYTVSKDNKVAWGYLDKKANWKIKAQFQEAKEFEKGIAKVKVNNLWGAIDEYGKYVIQPQYDTADFQIEEKLYKKKK